MSTSAISSSLLSQIVSTPSTANRFASDLNGLAQDLEGGNLSAAQDDYVTLTQDALNGATSATADTAASGISTGLLGKIAGSAGSENAFVSELNQVGTDLGNGDLGAAQGDLLTLDSTALNAASSATASGASAGTNPADTQQLIQAIMQGLEVGDNSVVGSAMSQLASISPDAQGASYLQQDSTSYSGSGSTGTSSISELLDGANTNNSSATPALLNLQA